MQRAALAKPCFAEPGPRLRSQATGTPVQQRTARALRCARGTHQALNRTAFSWRDCPATGPLPMNAQTSPAGSRQIYWPSVITVISAAILIGAEVFGAAFAGGWALAILFGLDDFAAHILQAGLFGRGAFAGPTLRGVLLALGVVIMGPFPRAPQGVEPFTRRA